MSNLLKFDHVPGTTQHRVIRVTGAADSSVDSLEYGTAFTSMVLAQLAAKRFSAVLELEVGRNVFYFQPYAVGGAPLQSQSIVIDYEAPAPTAKSVPNSLDYHSQQLGFERLDGERNVSFKQRLLQGAAGKADLRTYVPAAFATELASPFSRGMVRVHVNRTSFNRPVTKEVFAAVTPTEFKYTGSALVRTDGPVVFDPAYPYHTPEAELSVFHPIKLISQSGQQLADSDFEYEVTTNRIWLRNQQYTNQDIIIVYNYVNSYALTGDLDALKTAVEVDGHLLVTITDSSFHNDTTNADWLIPAAWSPVDETEDFMAGSLRDQPGLYLSVSQSRAFPLHEHAEEYLVDGSGLGTSLEYYVREVNAVDHRTWDKIVIGRDGLRDETIVPLYSAFPHLTDPARSGVQDTTWQSGAGQLGDLEPDSSVNEALTVTDLEDEEDSGSSILYGIL